MSSRGVEALRGVAQLFRTGSHQQGTAELEELQKIPSPAIVEIGTALLQEQLTADSCYAQFYAARVVRCAVVRDWASHWKLQSDSILQFAVQYLAQNTALLVQPTFKPLLSEMCSLWSVAWKVRCGDCGGCDAAELEVLASSVESLCSSMSANDCTEAHRIVLRALLSTLIEEFGLYHAMNHARVLPIVAHEACRRAFKERILFSVAQRSFTDGLLPERETALSAPFLANLWYAVMCWNFSNSSIDVSASSADRIPEELTCEGPQWGELFGVGVAHPTTGTVVPISDLFLTWKNALEASGNEAARDVVMQCVVQLSSLTAQDWPLEARVAHTERLATVLFGVAGVALSTFDLCGSNVLQACATAIHRLVVCVGCADGLFRCPRCPELVLSPLLQLTQNLITMLHDGVHNEDELVVESLDHLLHTWLEMVGRGFSDVSVKCVLDDTPLGVALADGAATVLKVFVHVKTHAAAAGTVEDVPETSHSKEYGESQTKLLALLGREQPSSTALYLHATLKSLSDECLRCLAARRACPDGTNEALWFTLCVIANFFADGSESERNSIPNSIVSLALHWERSYPDDDAKQESCNEVFSLLRLVLNFAAQLMPHLGTGLVSPGVCQSMAAVMRHYVGAYLFPDENLQLDFCPILSSAFSGGSSVADCALQFAATSLSSFPFDTEVSTACCRLLSVFTEKPSEFGSWVVDQKVFAYLVRLVGDQVPNCTLPGKVKGGVFGFLVSVCPTEIVLEKVVYPAATNLNQTLTRAAQTPEGQLTDVSSFVDAVDSLAGAFVALRTEDHTKIVFGALAPLIDTTVTGVQWHANHKPLLSAVLRMMNVIVESCSFLGSSNFLHVVEQGIQCIKVTKSAMEQSRVRAAGLSKVAASLEEDERVEVLTAASTFVLSVARWGLLDLGGDDADNLISRSSCIADLSVQGLLIVLSFSDASVLSIPSLRDSVFDLLKEVSSTFTGRFLNVSSEEAACLLQATEFAVTSSVPDLNRCGYKVMESIANYCVTHNTVLPLLHSFLVCVLGGIASGQCDMSSSFSVGGALFALCGALGAPVVLENSLAVFQSNRLLERPFEALKALVQATNFLSRGREGKNRFLKELESILLRIKGTKIA